MDRILPDEGLRIIERSVKKLETVRLPLADALGCVMSEDVKARMDQPPFARSPLDGYAVRAEDVRNATKAHPIHLKVVDRSYAGVPASSHVGVNEAVRIMTGGAIPEGADCIVKQEDTDLGIERVHIFAAPAAANVSNRGEDFSAGDVLLRAGTKVAAASIAVAAAAGYIDLPVIPRPKAALLATGEELQQVGQTLAYGQIYDSNTPYLIARFAELRISVTRHVACGDRLEDTATAIRELSWEADCIITTGGVSIGERDLVPDAIRCAGGELLFHGVAMKPGMPTLLAMLGGKPVLGLSGNPYSAAVALERFGRAIFAALGAESGMLPTREEGLLLNDYHKGCKTVRYLRGIYENGAVFIPKAQGNAQLHSFVDCNCLVEILPDAGPIQKD